MFSTTKILHRDILRQPPVAITGENVYIIDQSGNKYIDASGGAAISCLGHSCPEVIDIIKKQLDKIPFVHSSFFSNSSAEELADLLIGKSPQPLKHVYYVSGGSEANEAALKLARQFFVEKGQPNKRKFIARKQSYHGATLGVLSLSDNKYRREYFEPLLKETKFISPCYSYRYKILDESDEVYGARVANELENEILRLGPENTAAFIAETVVGATLGAVPAVKGYFKRIREICDKYEILLILDEIMCGTWRTGKMFAFEEEAIVPDIVTLGKNIAAGFQPLGVLIFSDAIYQTLKRGTGIFRHGHTYSAHASACAAGLGVLRYIEKENLPRNINLMGEYFLSRLKTCFKEHPYIGDIRGRGLFIGIELVADKFSKKAHDNSLQLNRRIKEEAFNRRLICYPMGGTADGIYGTHILLAPPFIFNKNNCEEVIEKLYHTVNFVFNIK